MTKIFTFLVGQSCRSAGHYRVRAINKPLPEGSGKAEFAEIRNPQFSVSLRMQAE